MDILIFLFVASSMLLVVTTVILCVVCEFFPSRVFDVAMNATLILATISSVFALLLIIGLAFFGDV